MDTVEVRVPADMGKGAVVITEWFVADGGIVSAGQRVGEAESTKVTADLTAPAAGLFVRCVEAGTEVEPGSVVAIVAPTE
jgi:biotin carboxyl carrier protein